MATIERVRPARPLTARQERVVSMIADGMTYYAIARHLGCGERSVLALVYKIARRIPGNLEPRPKLIVWWRGASLMVLMGGRHCDNSLETTDAA